MWKIFEIWLWASNRTTNIPFQSDADFSPDGNPIADAYFLSNPEGIRGLDLSLDFNAAGSHDSGSKKSFTFSYLSQVLQEVVSPLDIFCLRDGSLARLCACLVFVLVFLFLLLFYNFFLLNCSLCFAWKFWFFPS